MAAGGVQESGGVHNWSESTVDEQRGIAFINFGSPRFDFYGGDRQGDNLFGNSLVAIDARTGRRIWHHQLVHHDLWDYDLPQAPKLLTIRQDGRNIDIVAQATKHGFLFVFERETGRPIWPIEERQVPQSDVPGEYASPTQPFPTKPAPFARQSFTEKDINPYLPAAERQAIAERIEDPAQRGAVHAAQLRGLDLDARSQRRRELPDVRRRSDARRDVRRSRRRCRRSIALRCRRRPGGRAAAAVAAVVGRGGRRRPIITPEQKAEMIRRRRRWSTPPRRRATSSQFAVALRVHEQQQLRHERPSGRRGRR